MTPALTLLLTTFLGANAPAPKYMIETGPAKEFTATYRTDIRWSAYSVSELHIYTSAAPELASQTNVKTTPTPAGEMAQEVSALKRPIFHAVVRFNDSNQAKAQPLTVKYEGKVIPRRLVPLRAGAKPPVVTPLTEEERTYYLAATKTHDFKEDPFQKWLTKNSLRRREGEADVDLGRRVYQAIFRQFTYDVTADAPTMSVFCSQTKGDCDGLAQLFVSAMRANEVPARLLSGFALKSQKPDREGRIIGHARAEFYAEGVGWVPVDLAFAKTKGKNEPLSYFGQDPADFITMHVDRDLIVETPFGPKEKVNLNKPSFHSKGKSMFDAKFYPVSWDVSIRP